MEVVVVWVEVVVFVNVVVPADQGIHPALLDGLCVCYGRLPSIEPPTSLQTTPGSVETRMRVQAPSSLALAAG